MTAPNGPILFNNSTGSDTTASGLGAANVYGTGASTIDGSAVVTGISTTGVSAGDLLWVQSSSGRQFSIIATVDSSTQVTCDDTFDNTESGRTWAIGGKRATWENSDSRQLFNDATGGWIIKTETDQYLTTTGVNPTAGGSSDNLIIVDCENNTLYKDYNIFWTPVFNVRNWWRLKNARVTTSTSQTGVAMQCAQLSNWQMAFFENVNVDCAGTLHYGFYLSINGGCYLSRCSVSNAALDSYWAPFAAELNSCSSFNAGRYGLTTSHTVFMCDCLFDGCGSYGIYATVGTRGFSVRKTVVSNSGGDGIRSNTTAWPYVIEDCILSGNSGYGIINSNSTNVEGSVYGNAFYNNTSGQTSGLTNQSPITLTADPFVSAANGNFNLNDFPGGGNLLRAKYYELGGN